jgi:hypothetical protein
MGQGNSLQGGSSEAKSAFNVGDRIGPSLAFGNQSNGAKANWMLYASAAALTFGAFLLWKKTKG